MEAAAELIDALRRTEQTESAHAVVMTGEGGTFSSGFDLSTNKRDA